MSSSKEYSSWESMKARCLNSNNLFYNNYGGRGIKVCKRWLNFKNFYKDMGDKPSKDYSLERIDVNGNYCSENCKWATRREQDRNRRTNVFIEYKNKTYILSDLAKKVGLHQQTIKSRLDRGLPMEEVVSKNYNYTKS